MGQATIEAQHTKAVLEEMAIPNLNPHITMSINTENSAGSAVANRLGLNTKTKHVQLRVLYIQDVVQHGEKTITKIPTTQNPADVLTKHLPSTTIQSQATLSTDDATDSQHTTSVNIGGTKTAAEARALRTTA
eukprot:557513-Amphidinium_carterae.1